MCVCGNTCRTWSLHITTRHQAQLASPAKRTFVTSSIKVAGFFFFFFFFLITPAGETLSDVGFFYCFLTVFNLQTSVSKNSRMERLLLTRLPAILIALLLEWRSALGRRKKKKGGGGRRFVGSNCGH